jgi:hypothetical protein
MSILDISRQAFNWQPKQSSVEPMSRTQPNEDNFEKQGASRSASCVFCILAVLACAQMLQFCVVMLGLDKMPGNKFINGIIFGCGEVVAMVSSNVLMTHMHDTSAFLVAYAFTLVSQLILTFFPEVTTLTYLGNIMLITGVGSWFNIMLLILEMRVPPQNVGAVSALTRTMALATAVTAPTIAQLAQPWPYVVLMAVAGLAMILSFALPPPGLHLPTAQKNEDQSVILIDRQTNMPVLAHHLDLTGPHYPMTNYALHQASFQETFTERALNVTRP